MLAGIANLRVVLRHVADRAQPGRQDAGVIAHEYGHGISNRLIDRRRGR